MVFQRSIRINHTIIAIKNQKAMFAIKSHSVSCVKFISFPPVIWAGIVVIWINKSQKVCLICSQLNYFKFIVIFYLPKIIFIGKYIIEINAKIKVMIIINPAINATCAGIFSIGINSSKNSMIIFQNIIFYPRYFLLN